MTIVNILIKDSLYQTTWEMPSRRVRMLRKALMFVVKYKNPPSWIHTIIYQDICLR